MRAYYPAIFCLASCAALSSCKSSKPSQTSAVQGQLSDSLTRTVVFAPDQQVHFDLNIGDVQILPDSNDQELRLTIQPKHPVSNTEMQSWVHQFDVSNHQADIRLTTPKHANVTVRLYVPSSTSLNINAGVGNLNVDRIRGDKDLHVGVGDLRIDVAHLAEIGHVETHTRIGDIHDALNRQGNESGFLGKDENFSLGGLHHLQASTGIGDVTIDREGNS